MEQETIIPTRHKSKIPHTLSYPIGAKAISDALRGVPQFDALRVDFDFWNPLARDHGTSRPYEVISAWYCGTPGLLSGWVIRVHAVPRSLRHEVQAKVLAEALPAIRSWFVSNPHASDREGAHILRFSFDELKDELTLQETASMDWRTEKSGP